MEIVIIADKEGKLQLGIVAWLPNDTIESFIPPELVLGKSWLCAILDRKVEDVEVVMVEQRYVLSFPSSTRESQ